MTATASFQMRLLLEENGFDVFRVEPEPAALSSITQWSKQRYTLISGFTALPILDESRMLVIELVTPPDSGDITLKGVTGDAANIIVFSSDASAPNSPLVLPLFEAQGVGLTTSDTGAVVDVTILGVS